ncbi:MAG: hypothetical protein QF410_03150 [Planctomycetota bacterium]|jgi:hypothetical protein|nr:hypothetical protein [Planctomycetota bacterium]MDP6761725.1 hypothetical protein [Planctomycetota bacterium]
MNRPVLPAAANLRLAAALSTLALTSSPAGAVGDPFQPGLRWVHAAELSAPWLPAEVSLTAGGELVWAAGFPGEARLMVLTAPGSGAIEPLFEDLALGTVTGALSVCSGEDPTRLFALAQYPAAQGAARRTRISRYDALAAGAGQPFTPGWTTDLSPDSNGPALFACDASGGRVVAATWDDAAGRVHLTWLDGHDGAALAEVDYAAPPLTALSLSADGSRLVVAAGPQVRILDAAGAVLHVESLPAPTPTVALSADGGRVVFPRFDRLAVLDEVGGAYVEVAEHDGAGSELALRCAVAADGTTYAVGWWEYVSGSGVRLETFEGTAHQRVHEFVQQGSAAGLQNSPAAVAVSADGRRVAFGCWGAGDDRPELILADMGEALPVLEVDLPGSVLGLALEDDGASLVLAAKNLHANQVGSTGEVRLYDTRPRDLAILAPAQVGGTLELAARAPGGQWCLFLLGRRAAQPTVFPGVGGGLALDRTLRLRVFPRAVDAAGRADLVLPLPDHPALRGLDVCAQAFFRGPGGSSFTLDVVDPLIL